MADFSFSEDAELKQLNQDVLDDPENFEHWNKLVLAAEQQEGGIHRNSSPSAIAATREVYDRLLVRFPLFFGYWKKYADLEFAIAGTEAADMVYERGVASIGNSVDLWAQYCAFKTDTCHDPDVVRELFERGADAVGLDFLSHPFWEKFIDWEERNENPTAVYNIYQRLMRIPTHQYNRYFEMTARMESSLSFDKFLAPGLLAALQQSVQEDKGSNITPYEMEQSVRARLKEGRDGLHARIAGEVGSRWEFESAIKRPYYHVTPLDELELENWRSYLTFEESMGDYERTKFLYERCVVTAANYEEFWFRYARWMSAQGSDKEQEVRSIYQRASCTFVPIACPDIRLLYAAFEESMDRFSVATDIHEAILINLPYHVETITSLAGLTARMQGPEAGRQVLERHIAATESPSSIRGALVTELARSIYEFAGDAKEAAKVWERHVDLCRDSLAFWSGWFDFAIAIPISSEERDDRHRAIVWLYEEIKTQSALKEEERNVLTSRFLDYLRKRGPLTAMKDYMRLDLETFGPSSSRSRPLSRSHTIWSRRELPLDKIHNDGSK